ncbi:hypothetical protein BZL30_4521 [Mycobacterium kansasii]|uniref:Uncharacterized protein n=1 Tax=Mycobacterium kansasii TaxID=1768 RepID=A0A1V3X4Q1_MYCKA|nr:hypothetical protein BZL29_8149 [Mycobacterium kansasii]OOK74082.1 hypothetical protein BZL30_4521 [Mycobacterium kansasii]
MVVGHTNFGCLTTVYHTPHGILPAGRCTPTVLVTSIAGG